MEKRKIGKATRITVWMVIAIVIGLGLASAYDADNPWTGTVQWTIPSDTSFTVTFAGSQTQVNFNAAGQNDTLIEPDGQDASSNTPIITIENTGNLNLNFTCNLTSAKPSWATIKVSNQSDHTTATEFDTTAVVINASVPPGGSTPMYLWSNVTEAPSGTTTRTLQINSAAA